MIVKISTTEDTEDAEVKSHKKDFSSMSTVPSVVES